MVRYANEMYLLWIAAFMALVLYLWYNIIKPWIAYAKKQGEERRYREAEAEKIKWEQNRKERAVMEERWTRQRNDAEQNFNAEKLRQAGKL